ncbi:TetR/AcrR family transcriptional regulator [Novosphingobium sp. B 225]|uniref:TetR/AcrR family transcriptional regulator n=1 Tax=Novosphingobium sp. B 225 TaxID=1961849 RepID=UPI000B4B5A34|nr:TetR/AcrR family transcriptional regulator [Novosphingobium sp. B 225]
MVGQKQSYHRANLEQELLDAATDIIASKGVAALSLRSLGDLVGVSRSAPYHYFTDKDELLHRLGERGFTMLAQATAAAAAGHDDPVLRARAGLHGYVRFARSNTQLFRLMFAGILPRSLSLPLGEGAPSDDFSSSAAATAFAALQAGIAGLNSSAGISGKALLIRTNAIWAAVHGVAVLAIDENLKLVEPEAVLDNLLDRLLTQD